MEQKTSALLIYSQARPLQGLHLVLELQNLKTGQVRTCEELRRILMRADPPHLLFTDTTLPDGTWVDVLNAAALACNAVNVIVVGRWPDVQSYVEAIERGAFDFIVPPFEAANIEHVVRCAAGDVVRRREARATARLKLQPPPLSSATPSAIDQA